jgi:DNA-binding SARP family transcriptional activator/tetratricopeptide (TPR) repeat protein
VEFLLLGPLVVRDDDGRELRFPRRKQRLLLVSLLLNPGEVVSRERLLEALWPEGPPPTASTALHGHVSSLRRLLGTERLVTQEPGYRLELQRDSVDVVRFERLLADAGESSQVELRAERLRSALSLWRGRPLAEFESESFARDEVRRLEDLRLRALEDRLDAELALGRDGDVVGELTALIADNPYRERLRRHLMLALYRAGRQPDSLAAYRDAHAALAELGLQPGPGLRDLQQAILNQDPALDTARADVAEPGRRRTGLPGALVPEPAFPFVGREGELARLRALLDRAEQGEGSVAVLAGEAGGGKTRLARELAHSAAARGALVLYGISDATVRIPYGPLRQWLEYLLRVCEPAELRECIGDGAILGRLVPELAAVAEPGSSATGDVEGDRYLLQHAARGFLTRLGRRRTVLAIVDDVHWADDETLHLLRALARAAPETRVLVIATCRDVPADTRPAVIDALADLWRVDGVTRLPLGRLTTQEVAKLVRESASVEATADLVDTLTELTGGTPLLVCELWRELRTAGAVEVSDTAVRLVGRIDDLPGPERIRDGVRQRLGRLGPHVAAIVELAAVAGPTFDVQLLTEAAGTDHAAAVPAALDHAVDGGLIEKLPGLARRFTHELVRRAVYDGLGPLRRAELHLHVGEALERMHADQSERVVQELAVHFTHAAATIGPERAIAYNVRAAEAALNADAYAEARDRLLAALELGIQDDRLRAHVQTELVLVQRGLGRFEESEPLLAQIPDEPFAASQTRFIRLMNDPTVVPEQLVEGARHAIETFAKTEDTYRLAVAWRHYGLVHRRQGRLTESLAAFESALWFADASGRQDAYRWAVGSLAYVLCDGPVPVPDAIRRVEELERSSPDDAMTAAILGQSKGALLAMAGRLGEAHELLVLSEAAFARSPTGGSNRPAYRELAAEAWELLGDPARAEHELVAKHDSYRRADSVTDAQALQAASHLAVLCCDQGRWDDAARWTEYGRDVPVPDHFHKWAVLNLAARSRIAAHNGDLDRALDLGRRAVGLVELSDETNRRARTWLALAEVQRERGDTAEADGAVATALVLCEAKGNVTAAARLRSAAGLSVPGGRDA